MEKLGKTIEENYNSNLPDDQKKKKFRYNNILP